MGIAFPQYFSAKSFIDVFEYLDSSTRHDFGILKSKSIVLNEQVKGLVIF